VNYGPIRERLYTTARLFSIFIHGHINSERITIRAGNDFFTGKDEFANEARRVAG